jgi:hypothetical protein
MGKIIVSENVTLDGVIEDPSGDEGFRHGGWLGRIDKKPLRLLDIRTVDDPRLPQLQARPRRLVTAVPTHHRNLPRNA